MKVTPILFLTFCLLIGKSATAQTEFAPLGAEWYYGSTGFNQVHYSHLWVEKDTVVDGINCRKIAGNFIPAKGDGNGIPPLYVYNNEDTIFYYNQLFRKFTPLFIFNVEKGDTITYYIPYFYYSPFYYYTPPTPPGDSLSHFQVKVDSVVVTTIDGQNLRRVWTSQLNSGWNLHSHYTEKIGSAFLPVPHNPSGVIPENGEIALRCYKDAEISYVLVNGNCDYSSGGMNELKNSATPISIHPNPNRGTFKLRIDLEQSSEMTGVMTDITGRQVFLFHIPNGKKEQEYQLNLSPGFYLISLRTTDGFYSQKLVIR